MDTPLQPQHVTANGRLWRVTRYCRFESTTLKLFEHLVVLSLALAAFMPVIRESSVEMWRGCLALTYLFPALSSADASLVGPCSVTTSRSSNRTCAINASGSRRKFTSSPTRSGRYVSQARLSRRSRTGIDPGTAGSGSLYLVFVRQPPTQPSAGALIDRPIGSPDRSKTEVVRPPIQHLIEFPDYFRRVPSGRCCSSWSRCLSPSRCVARAS
jgi:hypothetical protein